jgi:KUP system potassium uptake protein
VYSTSLTSGQPAVPRLDSLLAACPVFGDHLKIQTLTAGFQRVELHFGFAEKPDVPAALAAHKEAIGCDPASSSFFLGRETPVPSLRPDLPRWQERIYAFLTRNAVSAPDYFLIPPQRVVELGTKVEM